MKILVTTEKISFVYSLYSVEIPRGYIKYFVGPRGGVPAKYDIFDSNTISLRLKSPNLKVTSKYGIIVGYILYFFHRLFLGDFHIFDSENLDDASLVGNTDVISNYSPTTVTGVKNIQKLLEDLKDNGYNIEDISLRMSAKMAVFKKDSIINSSFEKFVKFGIIFIFLVMVILSVIFFWSLIKDEIL